MTLVVWTARISTRDPDALNITRKSGDPVFAPSWPLLKTALDRRKAGLPKTEADWKTYAASYLREMAVSYDAHRAHWDALLARQRVVLTCYCTDPNRCHRRILARVLVKLGAEDMGELPEPAKPTTDTSERAGFELAMALDDED